MSAFSILTGDSLTHLRSLPEESIQCVVTSPPYFGLRDYGIDGQIGLERTPEEYVSALLPVFREVFRVLRDDGTLWLNLGDSYAGSWGNQSRPEHAGKQRVKKQESIQNYAPYGNLRERRKTGSWVNDHPTLKPKDLIGVPWRMAFALQADGWYLRQDIIWHKPNPMPESIRDRCTKAHEYIFLLTKSPRYFYDHEAVQEPAVTAHEAKYAGTASRLNSSQSWAGSGKSTRRFGKSGNKARTFDHTPRPGVGAGTPWQGVTRNRRTVWTVTTKPFKEAHFATFPPDLIEPCILAGSKPGDVVLDPFNGAGTTGLVALKHGREYIGIELNPEYVAISEKRLAPFVTKEEEETVA